MPNPVPPPDWMLPDFDPNNAKVAHLRSILLENNIPHAYTKKAALVQLFDRQVKPMTPKLLKDHLSVKASADGIIDMRTGSQLQVAPPSSTRLARSPRKKAPSVNLTDHDSSTDTTSRRRTKPSASRSALELEQAASEADVESTPVVKTRRSAQPSKPKPPSSLSTPHRLGKRKVDEPATPHSDEDKDAPDSDLDPDPRPELSLHSRTSASMKQAKSSASPVPVKRRRSDYPIQPSTIDSGPEDDSPAVPKKKAVRPKNRRTTMHEAIEANNPNFSDFNPFQSGPDDDKSGSSSQKPRSSKRQSSASRPSIVPAQIHKSTTTSNIPSLNSPAKSSRSQPPSLPIHVPRSVPSGLSSLSKPQPPSNVRVTQTPAAPRTSGRLPSLPSNRRLTMLQDDYDLSSEHGTPEQIYRQLVPSAHRRSAAHELYDSRSSAEPEPRRPESQPRSAGPRQSQLLPRTPYAQPAPSSLQFTTPLPRPPTQRIRLDDLVHTPSEKKLKIKRVIQPAAPRRGLLLLSPSQMLSFLLRLSVLGLIVAALGWYREQTAQLGYCDTGRTSNAVTRDQRLEQLLAAEGDVGEGALAGLRARVAQLAEAASAVGILPDCQRCPAHAVCERGQLISCERDYVLRHSAWEQTVHGWLPGVMGPRCVPDTARLVKIVETAHVISQVLKQRRGAVLCGMGMRAAEEAKREQVDVDKYGMSKEALQEALKLHEGRWTEAESEMFELALMDLEKYGEVVSSPDGWLATSSFKLMELGWKCRLKIALWRLVQRFKSILVAICAVGVGWVVVKIKIGQRKEEKRKVKELVDLTLRELREQSSRQSSSSTNRSTVKIASAQLRDLILSHDHSILNRQKVWKKVEKVVEGNSNVRTSVGEVRGENVKVWEWIGTLGGTSSNHQHGDSSNTLQQQHHHHQSPHFNNKQHQNNFSPPSPAINSNESGGYSGHNYY